MVFAAQTNLKTVTWPILTHAIKDPVNPDKQQPEVLNLPEIEQKKKPEIVLLLTSIVFFLFSNFLIRYCINPSLQVIVWLHDPLKTDFKLLKNP